MQGAYLWLDVIRYCCACGWLIHQLAYRIPNTQPVTWSPVSGVAKWRSATTSIRLGCHNMTPSSHMADCKLSKTIFGALTVSMWRPDHWLLRYLVAPWWHKEYILVIIWMYSCLHYTWMIDFYMYLVHSISFPNVSTEMWKSCPLANRTLTKFRLLRHTRSALDESGHI